MTRDETKTPVLGELVKTHEAIERLEAVIRKHPGAVLKARFELEGPTNVVMTTIEAKLDGMPAAYAGAAAMLEALDTTVEKGEPGTVAPELRLSDIRNLERQIRASDQILELVREIEVPMGWIDASRRQLTINVPRRVWESWLQAVVNKILTGEGYDPAEFEVDEPLEEGGE